jgi:hypothetical protein
LCNLSRVKLAQIVLSAITAAGFVGAILGVGTAGTVIGIVVSTTLLALNSYMKSYDLGELAQKHKQAAGDLWLIREKYLSLLVDLRMKETPIESLQQERDHILKQLHSIYMGAPSTTSKAYKRAQAALQKLQDMTFSDAEIDAFLPPELQRSRPLERNHGVSGTGRQVIS